MELILIVVVLVLLSVAVDCGAVVVGGDDGSIGRRGRRGETP